MRDLGIDIPKTGVALAKALSSTCQVDGCNTMLSPFTGPGSDTLCRDHQMHLHEYGGFSKAAKPYTIGKTSVCEECGFDALEHPAIVAIEDPIMKNRAVRMIITTDHIDGNHSNNSLTNLIHICNICHNVKTIVSGDYLTSASDSTKPRAQPKKYKTRKKKMSDDKSLNADLGYSRIGRDNV